MTGRYRLVESIGQGGMGRVWRAADEILDRQVAVKEMRIDGLDAEDARTRRERTLREARATARIDHPNVVRVYDVVDEGERLWIVMELVAGRSLERVMAEEGPLGPRETARLGLGLVQALRQVHDRGVLHRDIKPGNVLVENGARRIVLTDFGIAAIQDAKALTMVGMLVGSPDYMAPERISGRPQGPPSDVWSLGATLCAAMGGRSPFSRDTTLATLHAVLYEEPELPATVGPLRDILAALLEKDPMVRPGLAELEASLRPLAYPAPPTTPTVLVGGGEGVAAYQEATPEAESAEGPSVEGRSVEGRWFEGSPVEGRPVERRLVEGRPPEGRDEEREAEPGPAAEPEGPDIQDATPLLPSAAGESPTPPFVNTRHLRTMRDPRTPAPMPGPEHARTPGVAPVPTSGGALVSGGTPVFAPASGSGSAPASGSGSVPASGSGSAPGSGSASGSAPAPTSGPEPAPAPQPALTPQPPSASTEAASGLRSETRSETPSGNSAGTAPAGATPPTASAGASAPASAGASAPASAGASAPVTPAQPRGISAAPTVTGVSLARAQAETERRAAPAPVPLPMPPGELPGPAVPADPRRRGRRAGRRTGLVAAVGVVIAGAVVAIVLASANGSPDDNRAGGAPSASSAQSPSTTPSDSPSPTVEGTSRPQSLPPGAHREAGGFAWATPVGWRRDIKTGAEVHYTSPDGKQELAAKSSLARGDLMETWRTSEQNAHQGKDYRKIRLEETTFRGNPAVVWEYTFTLEGVPWHARLLGFNEDGKSYQINTWYQPDIETQALGTYDKVKDSFTVL
ncbi:protein kinase [Streptomyces sp. NPDC058676]|uniref:serine/threonine-protein kinase n=1 Tax=unclassified Streptomyces TaxID=2593676 RepID=UPI0036690945